MSSRSIQSSCLESTSPIDFSSTHFRNSQPTIHYSSPRISKANAIAIDRELKQYSFDRAVICDDAEIARCLIANNFHFENKQRCVECRWVSAGYLRDRDGYASAQSRVAGIRRPRRQPPWRSIASRSEYRTTLVCGNDCQDFRCRFTAKTDLQSSSRRGKEKLHVSQTIPQPILATLQPEEVSWLAAGNIVFLESFPPQTILRIVTQRNCQKPRSAGR
jgi:hypothetical protein